MASAIRPHERKRIWGWYFFDWASQPYNTLLITFIFGPYIKDLLGSGAQAQQVWGYGIAAAGLVIAVLAPVLGAIADHSGSRMHWIRIFSLAYVLGAASLWFAAPGSLNLPLVMLGFGVGLVGMEFCTIFTNSMLPDLTPRAEIGRVSGSGWAFGYLGGLIALIAMLLFFAETPETGTTMLGIPPVLGLDPATREGTRFVGPLTAIWYAVFMIPFFVWVREPRATARAGRAEIGAALRGLGRTLRRLPETPSQLSFLAASMLYRDGLNGTYALGAIFAAGVLDWSVVQTGTFGILAVVTGAIFAWIGGRADRRFGPLPVIVTGCVTLIAVVLASMFIGRDAVLGVAVAPGSTVPDAAFMAVGALIGAAGGALQASSRTMMVIQGDRDRMTEAFGLYALSGKATSFIAPLSIAIATQMTGSQQLGIAPLIVLFAAGLLLLVWVKPDGDRAA